MTKQVLLFMLFSLGVVALNNQIIAQEYNNLKVTELHYHPLDSIYQDNDTVSGKNFEFIEFKNVSFTSSLDVSGVVIDSAINFVFPENTIIAPQSYYVAAAKPSKFYDRYSKEPNGNFSSSFSNGGEQVVIFASNGDVIIDFTYYDEEPWPTEPDGDGQSLVAAEINPAGDPNDYLYWKTSMNIHGSPGKSDPVSTKINDVFGSTSLLKLHPNPTNNLITVGLMNNSNDALNIEIYAINGSKVFSGNFQNEVEVYLNDLNIEYGMYFLKVKSESKAYSQKLIYSAY